MFDTVKLGIPISLTEQEIEAVDWTRTNSSFKPSKKEAPTIFKELHDKNYKGCPFIRYTYKEDNLAKCWLKVEVSIPTFLYGSNVYELQGRDLDMFYKRLRKHVADELKLSVSRVPPIDQCTVEKVHVCKNFNVGNLKQHYLKAMSASTIPRYQKRFYCSIGSEKVESIEWKATKKKEKLYDKEAELQQQGDYLDKPRHLAMSKGLLRYEIELSDREIRLISPSRRVADVLKIEEAVRILQKGLIRNGLSSGVKYTSIKQVLNVINQTSLPLRTKSSLIAFSTEMMVNGEDVCREKYSLSTFQERQRQLRSILGVKELLIGDILLPPLRVISDQKKTATVLAKQ